MSAGAANDDDIDWSRGEHQGPVQLPDGRHLYLIVSGPGRRSPAEPVVIIEHGLDGTASEWLAVQRLVARFARVYVYERAGHHRSDPPSQPPTSENIAADLRSLLTQAGIQPPYLLVGHSYGGVLIRQFLADYTSSVTGMVIVDSAPVVNRVPDSWSTLLGDATYEDVIGLTANRAVPAEEWKTIMHERKLNEGIAEQEFEYLLGSSKKLRDRLRGQQLLEDHRLSVVFCDESNDFRKVYEYGVEHGNGTEEAREALRKHLEDMSAVDEAGMRQHLTLSSHARFVKAEGKRRTHNVHLVDPQFVAREISWMLKERDGAL
ncbi:hypothetical protein LTR09_012152 [Extremus antarcticus]|uniref:AB hydrolase-1 domain-containing protein n=1 Tax=Extremus antarcticus TaxID=702011 RepID=A0AAJ0G7A6_9PEZI|nr:hypothetical protein LTR09_012152 [Extremus antarcticus]